MDIREYLQNNILLMDGAMETYFDVLEDKKESIAERANEMDPNLIKRIHRSYIEKGAMLIRTNTFAVNHVFFPKREEMR
ncbi:MAG: homocysteine S-methyltransferase family protein, partial [Clostridiales bacterium]|nr:homocysteine S-methyltransferase family protein [Clostridiales bacterium]